MCFLVLQVCALESDISFYHLLGVQNPIMVLIVHILNNRLDITALFKAIVLF